MKKLAILGAGSWGYTLAWLLTGNTWQKEVCLWGRNAEKIEQLKTDRKIIYPVEMELPGSLQVTASLEEAISHADAVLLVVTSAGTRNVLEQIKASGKLQPSTVLINASKGIEAGTLKRMSEVCAEIFPDNPYAVLSGPTLAKEIIAGLPTAAVVAAVDPEIAEFVQVYLSSERQFRLYTNTDVIGTELGGSLKNIFAIASGFMRTRQLGDNAWASLITRGLAEMTRLSATMGAEPKTLYGLSGLGDLLATCNSPLSRNYQVGAGLAAGKSLEEVLAEIKVVAEGVPTTFAVRDLCKKLDVDTPIIHEIGKSLSGEFSMESIVSSLMSRKLKVEGR